MIRLERSETKNRSADVDRRIFLLFFSVDQVVGAGPFLSGMRYTVSPFSSLVTMSVPPSPS